MQHRHEVGVAEDQERHAYNAEVTRYKGPDDVLSLARALIRIPTPNPPGEERPLAEFLAAYLNDRGLAAEVLGVGAAGAPQANVFARLRGSGERPPFILCGHLDTVPPGEGTWTRDPYEPAVEGDLLYGLGAADMKGAVAAMTIAACRLAAATPSGLAGDLLLAFTSGEETGSHGARALAASGLLDDASGMVIGEPTGNRVAIAEKGGAWPEIVVTGRTAHGSLPQLGANAVAGLVEALSLASRALLPQPGNLSERQEAFRQAVLRPEHPLLGAPTFTPTRIAGGVANNVVPDRASAVVDIRTVPGQSGEGILDALQALVEEIAGDRGLGVEVGNRALRVGLDTPRDHLLVRACEAAVEQALGQQPEICGLTGATDATELVPPLGLPFVICGPGQMAQAHRPNEFVSIPDLAASVEIYYHLARRLLARG
jgi:succinyl-diaminopimelate desuccinylase